MVSVSPNSPSKPVSHEIGIDVSKMKNVPLTYYLNNEHFILLFISSSYVPRKGSEGSVYLDKGKDPNLSWKGETRSFTTK